jgi:hypothetical protein
VIEIGKAIVDLANTAKDPLFCFEFKNRYFTQNRQACGGSKIALVQWQLSLIDKRILCC